MLEPAIVEHATETTTHRVRRHHKAVRWLDAGISSGCALLAGILILALLVDVLYGVVGRLWFSHGAPPWTGEIAGWLLVWVVFIGGSLAIRDNDEPFLRFVVSRLPPKVVELAHFTTDAIALCTFLFLIWYGIDDVQRASAGTGSTTSLSLGYLAAAVPVGASFMAYFTLRRYIQHGLSAVPVLIVVGLIGYLAISHRFDLGTNAFYSLSLGGLAVLLALGLPIAESMIVAAIISVGLTSPFSSNGFYTQQLSDGLNNFTFVAIPLFLLTGSLIAHTGAASRLTAFARSMLGWAPGGLAVADIGASAVFADISGSPVADTVALGSSMIPEMEDDGYPTAFAAGLQAAAGTLGVMFPPSISILIYASVANVSVSKVFAALLVPGLVVMFSFMIVAAVICARHHWGSRTNFRPTTVISSGFGALPALLTVGIVLGGIFSGKFTTSEAGAVASIYIVVVAAAGYRRRGTAFLLPAIDDAIKNTGRVGFIIAAALAYGQALTANNGPQELVRLLSVVSGNQYVLLAVLLLGLVVVGTILEPSTTPLVVVPVLLPILSIAGIDLIHFGVLLQLVAATALILPPLGLCLFLVSSIAKVPTESAARWAVPFILALVVDIALVMFIPPLTTWLPNLVHA